ncbi:MAG: pyridoxamine 5'-phosphate oxidase family protein, partial [Caldilineaceae bacterium]|nr:pyridoxamine 5'-phosphate oxidase family protein [Caldilineaceae bacterium]
MARMTETELQEFLQTGTICRLGCLDPDGHPYVVPCWFHYADGGFYIVLRERSAWATYLERDGRVSLCIDTEAGDRVLAKGEASVVERPNVGGKWVAIARDMVLRYRGEEGLPYLEATRNEPRWLFFV